MATVIIGGGIIGCSTAFYLSEQVSDPSSIHIVELSPILFSGASGYAGGFLAQDWFASSAASLGSLSFALHRKLAEEHDGAEKWGYLPSTAFSLGIDEDIGVGGGQRGEDWLIQGDSRANVVDKGDFLKADGSPSWITKQKGGTIEMISNKGGCAQVDPAQLCQFLLSESQKRGVKLHHPATVSSISTNAESKALESITITSSSSNSESSVIKISAKSVVFTAGPWTPKVFSSLFPSSNYRVPITSLAGHSLLLRTPRHKAPFTSPSTTKSPPAKYTSTSHAIFCAPSPSSSIPFAPELFSRATGEIYIAGVNSSTKPLPDLATEKDIENSAVETLRTAAAKLMGHSPDSPYETEALAEKDLTVEKVGLCWRPVTNKGTPIIGKIPEKTLGDVKLGEGQGVFIAAGHGPWGISLSLGTGMVVAEMVQGKETSANVDRLGIS